MTAQQISFPQKKHAIKSQFYCFIALRGFLQSNVFGHSTINVLQPIRYKSYKSVTASFGEMWFDRIG